VDSSADAIAACRRNLELNNVAAELVQSDVTVFLQATFAQQREYDVVVLDPPKLAPSSASLDKARRKYHGLNRDAIKVVSQQDGGLLVSCSCSAAMTQKDGGQYFLSMVHGAALAAGRQVTLLSVSGAASCHAQSPIAWPAGAYLTAAVFFVHPV
jgi:23S rRNA (cytosine1962-C5)-methyltransferase